MEAFLEELSLNAWPAIRQLHYDNWVLRFAGGHTRRSNSVNILGPSTIPLVEKIAYCEQAYRSARQPAVFKFAGIPGTEELEEILDNLGYQVEAPTTIMTLGLNSQLSVQDTDFRVESELTQEWFELAVRLTCVERSRKAALQQILQNIAPNRCFASACTKGQPAAIGIGVVERGWLGLFDIVTAPDLRRQGHGTKLMLQLLEWGRENGANNAYLQVVQANEPAIRLYESLGFEPSYQYWYRVKRIP